MRPAVTNGAAVALAALAMALASPAPAAGALLETGNLKLLQREAGIVLSKTSAVCLNAGCVIGRCADTHALLTSLQRADGILEGAEAPLLAWRELYVNLALSHLETARMERARIDLLRDLQLLQDSLHALSRAAAEAANWQDFILKYSEKTDKWWGFWSTRSNREFYDFLKHTSDHLKRLNSALEAPSIGKDRRQTIGRGDIAKFSAEAAQYMVDIRGHLKDGKGWRHTDTRVSVGKLLIKLGDLLVKIDRRARQGRIDEYIRSETAAHEHAAGLLQTARDVNDQLAMIAGTRRKLSEARRSAWYCAHRVCSGGDASRLPPLPGKTRKKNPQAATPVRPGEAATLLGRLRGHDREIVAVLHEMQEAVNGAGIRADTKSSVVLADSTPHPDTPVEAVYELSRCVPDDAQFVVHRLPVREGAAPLLVPGRPVQPRGGMSKGRLAFTIFPDLSGQWTDAKAGRFEIRVGGGAEMELVWKGMPVNGHDRVYRGALKRFSAPGKYRLALHSPRTGKSYFPLTIDVKRPGKPPGKPLVLKSTPGGMKDLNPKLPRKVRLQLLRDPLRTELSYLAEVRPQVVRDGTVRLAVDFKNFAFKWLGRDPDLKIYRPTIRKKSQYKTVLSRVP